jgi:class 3 adenylate cyclase
MNVWIETADGRRIPFQTNCYFGRSPNSTVCLSAPGASRRHAHIHAQEVDHRDEYWLADLGSTNGTLCNGRRVTIPCRLRDYDVLSMAGEQFTFRMDRQTTSPFFETDTPPTMPVRATQSCWLLMVDIKSYTRLATHLDTNALALKVGTWLRNVRDIVETNGGTVDKFLGDAVFSYWLDGEGVPARVAAAVSQLSTVQQTRDPDFRIVVHFGPVVLSGGTGGADNLSGSNVIYIFRMEKVSSALRTDTILSKAAAEGLHTSFEMVPVGDYPLDGFDGKHALFKLKEPAKSEPPFADNETGAATV